MIHARTQPDGTAEPPKRVYLVEDDPVERARVADVLGRAGYEVVPVPTLEAAVTAGFWSGDPAELLFVGRHGH